LQKRYHGTDSPQRICSGPRAMKHSLVVHDPGHFHAALLFFEDNSRVDPTIHVYAPEGPEVDAFIALIEGFNARPDAPTRWRINLYRGEDALEKLIAERPGETVILAGRNGTRLALMHRLHDAGFNILADKPWMTDSVNLPHLDAITAGAPPAVDIMTGRINRLAELRNAVIAEKSVFGDLVTHADAPAIELISRHHLLKRVDGRPLLRPPWFYDITVQGDGMVDIHSHYVDQAQWISETLGPDHPFDADRDMEVLDAERWVTEVPLALFQESTGADVFPDALAGAVDGDVLNLACNGRIDYHLRGLWVRHLCEWGHREPEGGSDLHGFTARGENAELSIRHGPETGFETEFRLHIQDTTGFDAAREAWRARFPGLDISGDGDEFLFTLPPAAQIRHEAQFPRVLDEYLSLLESSVFPTNLAARIRSRYTLIARARDHALSK